MKYLNKLPYSYWVDILTKVSKLNTMDILLSPAGMVTIVLPENTLVSPTNIPGWLQKRYPETYRADVKQGTTECFSLTEDSILYVRKLDEDSDLQYVFPLVQHKIRPITINKVVVYDCLNDTWIYPEFRDNLLEILSRAKKLYEYYLTHTSKAELSDVELLRLELLDLPKCYPRIVLDNDESI